MPGGMPCAFEQEAPFSRRESQDRSCWLIACPAFICRVLSTTCPGTDRLRWNGKSGGQPRTLRNVQV
jgi:hypothetical protein